MVTSPGGKPARLDADLSAAVQANDAPALVALAARAPLISDPEAAQLFLALGLVGRVVLDPRTATAALARQASDFHVLISPAFLLETVLTLDGLSFLFLHELAHLVLGHASGVGRRRGSSGGKRSPMDDEEPEEYESDERFLATVDNIAADMLVARFLHEKIGYTPGLDARVHGDGTSFFNALMATPETLLRRPWRAGHPLPFNDVLGAFSRRAAESELDCGADIVQALASIYAEVWTAGIALDTLTSRLIPLLARWANHLAPPLLLVSDMGSSGRLSTRGNVLGSCLPRSWRKALDEIREGTWENKESSMAGHSDNLKTLALRGDRNRQKTEALAARLKRFLIGAPLMRPRLVSEADPDWQTPVVTAIRRREAFWLSVGVLPPLYPFPAVRHQEPGPVRVYVDVSGSTQRCWRTVIDALRMVLSGRTVEAYQFSNVVRSLPLGAPVFSVSSTLGTDFNCVVRHALGISNSFIITDGYASLDVDLRKRAAAAGSRFHLLLLGDRSEVLEDDIRHDFEGVLSNERALIWLPRRLFGA